MNFTTIAGLGILATVLVTAAHAAWKAWHKAGDDLMALADATRERRPVTEEEWAEIEACWNTEYGGKR